MSDSNGLPAGFGEADPDFLQEQYAEAKKERSESGNTIFLKSGITHLRFLPPHKDSKSWVREFREHGLEPEGKFQTYTCPGINGDPCPICEEGDRLYETKDEALKEQNIVQAKRFRPKRQYLYNVYVHSSPDGKALKDGIHVLKSGVLVYKELMAYDSDHAGGWGDITNLQEGVEFRIERSGKGRFGTKYSAKPMPQRTNIIDKLAAEGYEIGTPTFLEGVYPAQSYDKLAEYLAKDEPKDEPENE
jgi:hypothetical protein